MTRALIVLLLTLVLVMADNRPANAVVVISTLPKGKIPETFCTKPLAAALKKVSPIHGQTTNSFRRFSCWLYYRGAQSNLQDLLDELGEIENLKLIVEIDRSGKPGSIPTSKGSSNRSQFYSYRIRLHWNQHFESGTITPLPQPHLATLTIHSAAGIKPEELNLPQNATTAGLAEREKANTEDNPSN